MVLVGNVLGGGEVVMCSGTGVRRRWSGDQAGEGNRIAHGTVHNHTTDHGAHS